MEEKDKTQHSMSPHGEKGFDYRKLIPMFFINWYWFVLSLIICLGAAYAYLRYTPAVYSGIIKVLIKDDSNRNYRRGASSMTPINELGLITSNNGFDNELEMVKSSYMALRAVKMLKLYVTYTTEGRVADQEMYKSSPLVVDLEESRLDELNTTLTLTFDKKSDGIAMHCATPGENPTFSIDREITALPANISTPYGTILITPSPNTELSERTLTVTITPLQQVARSYAARLAVTPASNYTSVAVMSLNDTQPTRILDYLKTVVECYNMDANDSKDEVGRRTENFINERIAMIRSELDSTEISLQEFKQGNELIDLQSNASNAVSGSNEYQRRQVEIQTQMTIVSSIIDYVHDPSNAYKVLPSSSLISGNTSITRLLDTYNEAVVERNRLIKTSSESSPVIVKLNETIESTLPLIQQSLQVYYNDLTMQKRSVDEQYARFTGKVANSPRQERALNNIMRQQEIKVSLYLTLLQKREENAISLASTAAKARVIDDPVLTGQVSPKPTIIWGGALALGVGLPIGILLLLELLRYRIESRADIEDLTTLPVLADIPLSSGIKKGQRAIVVHENSNNMMEEAFRGLRTNLRFVLTGDEKVILATSVIPTEGKTFVATNLAMSIALLGKKVLVVGLDIRKPRLVHLFDLQDRNLGLTSFLMTDGSDMNMLESQIFRGVGNPYLDVLAAGIVPPNPAELIARPQLKMAIDYLRTKYEYIIIDTPPIGLVSDTLDIASVADASLIVCRSEVSPKANFDLINDIAEKGKLPKPQIVFNGIDFKRRKYGYYYGYGKYGHYGRYGKYYGHYGAYGTYGSYGDQNKKGGRHKKG